MSPRWHIASYAASRFSARGVALFLVAAAASAVVSGQDQRHLDEVTVTAVRPLGEIGVQQTSMDSTALRENISLSMADVIGFNSSVFVKSSGRATLSTVSFRGAAASHTQTLWNGMPINSPSLGMTDFSLIPAYFIDRASLLYGSSSLTQSAGGLGGSVVMSTTVADIPEGVNLQYVQGAGSFTTFDEFLRVSFGGDRWSLSTRAVCSTSRNDFKFLNRDKKLNIYDDNHQIIEQYHPVERNRNGAYRDIHLLQEVYFTPRSSDRLGLNLWFTSSNREIPLTTVDYTEDREYDNRQRENTLRSIFSWDHNGRGWRTAVKAGYIHTRLVYDYAFEISDGVMNRLTDSRSLVNSFFSEVRGDWSPADGLMLTATWTANHHNVKSVDRASLTGDIGYDRHRLETSAAISTRWQITRRLGASAVLREDIYGSVGSAFTPALFADYLLYSPAALTAKASVSRNSRFPSLNDLYFIPGGNPDLKPEKGFTYDVGVSASTPAGRMVTLSGSLTWFDSHIDDWILWLPTIKGFFTPRNMKDVHSYGIEASASVAAAFPRGWHLDVNGSFSWTPSINVGDPVSDGDKSIGRQLPYIPRTSASATAILSWRSWSLLYKWCYYAKRFTMSSNENTLSGSLPRYFMSDLSLEKKFLFRRLDLALKLAVNNLFDAEYQTIMTRPMPGTNFELFISITPKIGRK